MTDLKQKILAAAASELVETEHIHHAYTGQCDFEQIGPLDRDRPNKQSSI